MTDAPVFFGDTGTARATSYQSPLQEILTDLKRKHVVAAAATGSMSFWDSTDAWNLQHNACSCGTTPNIAVVCSICGRRSNSKSSHRTERLREREDVSNQPPQHAQALLRRTPHLRHVSNASIDMQATHKGILNFMRTDSSQPLNLVDYRTCVVREQANQQAARELASFLWVLAHEMSLDSFSQVESAVFTKIFQLVHSTHTRMAGVAALDALIEAPSGDEEQKAIKFANNLSSGLRASQGDYEFWSSVSCALGHMAMRATNVDFVESEIVRALEWMRTDRSDRRLAATLTLKELAIHAPTAFYSKTSQVTGSNEFLDHIFAVLSDVQPIVRACAADALSQCLKILVDRHQTSLTALLCQVYFGMMEGLDQSIEHTMKKQSQTQIINAEARYHGSLLVVASMLEYTRDFMLPRYDEVCESILKFTNHPKALIRLEVIRLVPRLARRFPRVFGRRYLETALVFLIHSASNPTPPRVGVDIRPSAFCAIGHLILAMNSEKELIGGSPSPTVTIMNQPDVLNKSNLLIQVSKTGIIYKKCGELFELVKGALRPGKLGTSSSDIRRTALHCAADLVEALGPLADPYLKELINDMFTSGLSDDLISCLQAIATSVPSQQSGIEDRLLQEVSLCLAGTPNAADICNPLSGYHVTESSLSMSGRLETIAKVVLSLQTLGSFGDSDGMVAIEGIRLPILLFVRKVAAHYLQHPSSQVRRAAALTCCKLLIPVRLPQIADGVPHDVQHAAMKRRLGIHSGRVVEEVLTKLIQVSVSDPSPVVRLCVVRALDERYDYFLCQAHHLQAVFFILQDEALATRAAGLQLLGRLTRLNPAPILPFMRQYLKDLIIELRYGGDHGRVREEATRLLVVYLRAEPFRRLVQPVLPALVDALPLEGVAPRLASVALEALGELARASQASLKPWVKLIVPHILETMQDQSSASKQRTSLRTLGQISGSTGYVIKPYFDYPQLLSQATDVLPGTKRAPWALRREVIRTLGIVGALDPDQYHNFVPKTRKGGAVGGVYFVERTSEGDLSPDTGQEGTDSVFKEGSAEESRSLSSAIKRLPIDIKGAGWTEAKGLLAASTSPRKHTKENDDDMPAHLYMYEQYAMVAQPVSRILPPRRMTPSDDDFYPTVAIQALTRIFKDPSLAVHHDMVMQAIMFIFNFLGQKCVPFLDKVVPHMLYTIRTCGPSNLREALLKQVASLSGIVREHLHPYAAEIFSIVDTFWATRHLGTILNLVSRIAAGVPDDFRIYLPQLMTKLLASLGEIQTSEWVWPRRQESAGSSSAEVEKLELVLTSIRTLRTVIGEYLHIIVPALLKLADSLLAPSSLSIGTTMTRNHVTIMTLQTLSHMLQYENSRASGGGTMPIFMRDIHTDSLPAGCLLPARAVQPLIRFLSPDTNCTRTVGYAVVETICVCVRQMGPQRWKMYHDVARAAILVWEERMGGHERIISESQDEVAEAKSNASQSGLALYDRTLTELDSPPKPVFALSLGARHESFLEVLPNRKVSESNFGEYNGGDDSSLDQGDFQNNPSIQPILNQTSKHKVNQISLQKAWDVSQKASREDWDDWMRRFGIQLLKESPSPALRATASLAHAYQPLARELFSAAFVCCWEELSDQFKGNLVQALESAFVADVSPEILQTLLNLAEFMEHDGVASDLPIDISNLAELALKCRAYAKALHYKEREYIKGGTGACGSCVSLLISINKKLDLPEAGLGVLKTVRLPRDGLSIGPLLRHDQGDEMKYSVVSSTANVIADEKGITELDEIHESWLAKLGSWSEALTIYEQKLGQNPYDFDAILGCMRCLDASGEWQAVLDLADTNWPIFSGAGPNSGHTITPRSFSNVYLMPKNKRKLLKFSAQAAWRLGQWEELEKYAAELVQGHSGHGQANSPATNRIGQISDHRDTSSVPGIDFDGAFYTAVLNIHRKEWSLAADAIDEARKSMDSRFTALMAESYKRAYPSMVTAQTLAEMEEIIEFRKLESRSIASGQRHPLNRPDKEEARRRLLSTWRERLAGCRFDSDVHASIMAVRSLVMGPTDAVEATLTLSDLCRQGQRYKLAERVLLDPLAELGANLSGPVFGFGLPDALGLGLPRVENSISGNLIVKRLVAGNTNDFFPQYSDMHKQCSSQILQQAGGLDRLQIQYELYFAYVKHLWSMDQRGEASHRLEKLCNVVDMIAHCEGRSESLLQVSCWIELGDYKLEESASPGSHISLQLQVAVLSAFRRAISVPNCGYKAWHNWALLNFRITQQMNESEEGSTVRQRNLSSSDALRNHVIEAVKGFTSAISLGTKRWSASVQQDLLNLLTCLFKYGDLQDVSLTIELGIGIITLEAWLGVLPQLLARIQIQHIAIRSVLHSLLKRLGEKHPQALMYPLSVLLKSPVTERKVAAESLMTSLKAHSSSLVEEALMVSSELIRVAILWLETWHEGLEDASRLYYGDGNVAGMLDLLLPLHETLEKGAETQKEHEFEKSFGLDLAEAHAYVREYIRLVTINGADIPHQGAQAIDVIDGNPQQSDEAETAMNKAWDIYYTVFRRINKQLPALTKLELNQCSPALFQAWNLELGVPGSYRVDGSYIKIESFIPSVQVITSKQRPRKVTVRGNDGRDYVFLLKGHEDLRQDERVMQLFGLVNALLARDRQTKMYDLNIQRYAISPLSHNCGVVGWVPHCDTLHSLVRDYRQQKKVPLNMENREMLTIAPDYDMLTVMQKVEVFTDALRRTTGNGYDLYEILWLKSTNSEEWLERRTKYIRSLAVMSMVGYILGLGDRHPSNLTLDQLSGRVLHIDFGDCFEVAMKRDKYPEMIPFRLTRMLIKAMEVSGIEGSYRSTCLRTMTVLRDSRDSLVAMLEAFVYDPLISWRLAGLSDSDTSPGEAFDGAPNFSSSGSLGNDDSFSNDVLAGGSEGALIDMSLSVLHESISEGNDEEDNDGGEPRPRGRPIRSMLMTGSSSLAERIHADSMSERNPVSQGGSMNAARARSLQIFSSIQALAANLSASSRIASVVGDNVVSNGHHIMAAAARGSSLAQSRIAIRQRESMSVLENANGGGGAHEEALNEKALKVIRRVQDKLSGTDFPDAQHDSNPLDVSDQVQRLIIQATSSESLCQLYIGWCAFW